MISAWKGAASLSVRSAGVSVLTTLLDVGLFMLCTVLLNGLALLVARWVCGGLGALSNFALNRSWAFKGCRGSARRQLGRYAVIASVAVTLATAVWWGLFRGVGLGPRLAHVASMALVWGGFTLPLLRRWVFPVRS